MGYGSMRTPEEVQRRQGGMFDFDKVKERYESTDPLRGIRKKLDVRPIWERDRCHERIVKVSDEEYYITCNAYRWSEIRNLNGDEHYKDYKHTRAITYRKDAGNETITIHVPRSHYSQEINSGGFSSSSTFYFYKYNMPKGLDFINDKADKYVVTEHDKKYYPIEKADVVITRKNGTEQWSVLSAMRKVVHRVDRKQAKPVRQKATAFIEYIKTMLPIVEKKYDYSSSLTYMFKNTKKPWEEFVTPKGDDIPEEWFKIACHYKYVCERSRYNYKEHRYEDIGYSDPTNRIMRELYQQAKPFKTIEIPLGEKAHDRYKNWF